MTTYYRLINNSYLGKAASVERINGVWVSNPTTEQYASIGAYPRSDESFAPPKCDEGFHAVADGYEVVEGKWAKKWRVEAITYTEADYDNAMEDYLRQVRSERGYTLREPSPTYDDSPNPRWRADAADWKVFFTEVMEYGLGVQNEYASTGIAPTLEQFKASLPKIVWSYKEGGE